MVRGNKTAWEDEANAIGMRLRGNNALVGIGLSADYALPGEAFNRGGFRSFGDVGAPTQMPNGKAIEYAPLAGVLGFGGSSGQGQSGPTYSPWPAQAGNQGNWLEATKGMTPEERLAYFFGSEKTNKDIAKGLDWVNATGMDPNATSNFQTFVGPPQKLNFGDKGYFGKNTPETLNFWDTKAGRWSDELADLAKGIAMPGTIPFSIAGNLLETMNPNSPDYNYRIANAINERFGQNAAGNIGKYGKTAMSLLNAYRTATNPTLQMLVSRRGG